MHTFSHNPDGADEVSVERYTKAYLLYLINVVLFADKTSSQVQMLYLTLTDAPWERIEEYKWGFATLNYLYRRLFGGSKKESEGDCKTTNYSPSNINF